VWINGWKENAVFYNGLPFSGLILCLLLGIAALLRRLPRLFLEASLETGGSPQPRHNFDIITSHSTGIV
jgi:hypothetical protein